MHPPRILSVGQCAFDHATLARHLARHFHALVAGTDSARETLDALRSGSYNLVLVNRILDSEGSSGLDLIRTLKADPVLSAIPVMLVSNYPEAQAQAVALGALPGFGKAERDDPKALQALRSALEPMS